MDVIHILRDFFMNEMDYYSVRLDEEGIFTVNAGFRRWNVPNEITVRVKLEDNEFDWEIIIITPYAPSDPDFNGSISVNTLPTGMKRVRVCSSSDEEPELTKLVVSEIVVVLEEMRSIMDMVEEISMEDEDEW